MANRFARKTGNWNASDVWSDTAGGTAGAEFIPAAGDVAMANSFTVTINVNATCAEIRTDTTGGATAGGGFTLADGVTITAKCYAGTSTAALTFSAGAPAVAYLIGYSEQLNNGPGLTGAVNNAGTGTLYITGNTQSGIGNGNTGSGFSVGTNNASSGTIYFVGSCFGGGLTGYGIRNNAGGVFTVTGHALGGFGSSGYGAINISTGPLTIEGNATGGSGGSANGAQNNGTGTVTVQGNAIGGVGSSALGAINNSTGTVTVTGDAIGGAGVDAYGIYNALAGHVTVQGNAIGGEGSAVVGARNNGTGTITIQGNAIGGAGGVGAHNIAAGTINVWGLAIGNNWPNDSLVQGMVGVHNANNSGMFRIGGMKSGTGGWPGTNVARFFTDATNGVREAYLYKGNQDTLVPLNGDGCDQPTAANVRSGVSYASGSMIGSCIIPPVESVAFGVPVDTSTGTALIDIDSSAINDIVAAVWANAERSITQVSSGGITVASFDQSTAFPLTSIDSGATTVARTGGDNDTLETLSDQLDLTRRRVSIS